MGHALPVSLSLVARGQHNHPGDPRTPFPAPALFHPGVSLKKKEKKEEKKKEERKKRKEKKERKLECSYPIALLSPVFKK